MRSFKELSKSEKKTAMDYAINEAMKLVALGQVDINYKIVPGGGQHQMIELLELLEPIARDIAEKAFYPDVQDIVIKLWES